MVHTNIVSDDTSKLTEKTIDNTKNKTKKTAEDYLNNASNELKERFFALRDIIISLGDDVQEKKLKNYFDIINSYELN